MKKFPKLKEFIPKFIEFVKKEYSLNENYNYDLGEILMNSIGNIKQDFRFYKFLKIFTNIKRFKKIKKRLECDKCDKTFAQKRYLEDHKDKEHAKYYVSCCKFCLERFKKSTGKNIICVY
jgi:hypothetical protein